MRIARLRMRSVAASHSENMADADSRLSLLALNCSLKAGRARSSTEKLRRQVIDAFAAWDADCELVRVADYDVKPRVSADEGDGDEWPDILAKILAADMLVMGTPIWMGHASSIAQRVCEHLATRLKRARYPGKAA